MLEILTVPDPVLKQKAAPLEPSELDWAKQLARDLEEFVSSIEHCVGIAAPQVGILKRLCVIDVEGHPKAASAHGRLVMVNPEILVSEGHEIAREGCLSIPELTADVGRATTIRVRFTTPWGEECELQSEGYEARAIQHEIDHLDGILILDRVASLHRDVFRRQPGNQKQDG